MNDPTKKNSAMVYGGTLLLACLMTWLLIPSPLAYAVTGNVSCSSNESIDINLGTLTPSQRIEQRMSGTCKVLNTTYTGALVLSHQQQYTTGQGPKFMMTTVAGNLPVPELPFGSQGGLCLNNCYSVASVGQSFNYDVLLSGNAPAAPGRYGFSVYLATAAKNVANRADQLDFKFLSYTVAEPPCSMEAAKTLSVPFGAISSNDLGTAGQPANITVNCIGKGTLVTAQLIPTQAAVSGKVGVSATSLDGVSMAVTWADNNDPVVFNSQRSILMSVGANTIGFKFRPELTGTTFPTGFFFSQYTFNLTYY